MTRRLSAAVCAALVAFVLFGAAPTSATQAINFNGIVSLPNCSGALVRWSTSVATDKALMLTNGHCYRLMGSREVVTNQSDVRDVTLLKTNGAAAATVQTTKLRYATMWQTDVALYELSLTYRQVNRRYGVHAITLANTKPSPNDQPISIISGYWKAEYDCDLNGFAYRLREDIWTWRNSLRYQDGACEVIGGTSGSPVLDVNRQEIGINNTRNEDGQQCTFDNPCEVNRRGVISVHPGRGYGQETWVFYTCLRNNQLDLNKFGCQLPKP